MNVNIIGKNFKTYPKLESHVEKKFEKLGKYFADEITANVVLSQERNRQKIEATINARGTVFRSEEAADDIYEAIDFAVDKLARQMTKYKGKLQKRYNDNKALKFEFVPEPEEDYEEAKIVRTKKFDLRPMTAEEAVLEMELLSHDWFVFMDDETDTVSVIYRRKDGNYGLLETKY